jgi:phosphoenolpyruvate carboxykinase (GTP)
MAMALRSTAPSTVIPTTNKHLIRGVEKMAELEQPASIHWIDWL